MGLFHFMQGFLSSGTLGFHCTENIVGEWARRNPEETKMIVEQGHDLANHSENHFKMSALSNDKVKKEILDCTKTIEEIRKK